MAVYIYLAKCSAFSSQLSCVSYCFHCLCKLMAAWRNQNQTASMSYASHTGKVVFFFCVTNLLYLETSPCCCCLDTCKDLWFIDSIQKVMPVTLMTRQPNNHYRPLTNIKLLLRAISKASLWNKYYNLISMFFHFYIQYMMALDSLEEIFSCVAKMTKRKNIFRINECIVFLCVLELWKKWTQLGNSALYQWYLCYKRSELEICHIH